jgi:hypothetical protein
MTCRVCGYAASSNGGTPSTCTLQQILQEHQEHIAAVRQVLATIPKSERDHEVRLALQEHIREIDLPANGHEREADLRHP